MPALSAVVMCVGAVVSAVTGAARPVAGVQFALHGHWVYQVSVKKIFHIDGATATVTPAADYPGGDSDTRVIHGDTKAYIVDNNRARVDRLDKSTLEVEDRIEIPTGEVPAVVETAGGPYLVYRGMGVVVRLGETAHRMPVGGPLGDPVATSDGTLWLHRTDTGHLCKLPKDANEITSCPASAPKGHRGGLTVVDDKPVFVNASTDTAHPVGDDGLGAGLRLGIDIPDNGRVASTDADGRAAILDPEKRHLYLVDVAPTPDRPAQQPHRVDLLPGGDYTEVAATGSVVAVVDQKSATLYTYNTRGEQRDITEIDPAKKGDSAKKGTPRLVRGEDARLYVEAGEGDNVLVVDPDGKVTEVPVGRGDGPGTTTGPTSATPGSPSSQPPTANPNPDGPVVNTSNPPGPRTGNPGAGGPTTGTGNPPTTTTRPPAPPPPPPAPATPPGTPSAVQAVKGNRSAVVSWGAAPANGSAITGYRVTWRAASGATGTVPVGGGASQATVPDLTPGESYTVAVAAVNAAGAGPAASAATPVVPFGVIVTRGPATTYGDECEAPDCAFHWVILKGFEPNTEYHIRPWSSDPDWGQWNKGADTRTDANGDGDTNRHFPYSKVGTTVWIEVQTPQGWIKSNEYVWEGAS